MSAQLQTTWGPRFIEPTVRGVTVGRYGSAQVALEHPSVSPRHALLALAADGILLRDLGSRHGTFVGSHRVQRATLRSGDRVTFGTVAYKVNGRRLENFGGTGGLAFQARNLTVNRGDVPLLRGIHLDVKEGTFVGILGLSGSGKSTLLKCLAGYIPPASGSTLAVGEWRLPEDVELYRQHVGYVPQDDLTIPSLSARTNLDFALRLRGGGITRRDRRRLIDDTLKHLRLSDAVAAQPVSTLSGGERRRLSVGIELLGRPRVLLLDEPTSGLDPAAETDIMNVMRGIAQQGVTVFCATHVMANVQLFDTLLIVAQRRIDYEGPADGLLHHYGATNYPQLYRQLEKKRDDQLVVRAVKSAAAAPLPRKRMRPPERAIGLTTQIGILTARGIRLIASDSLFAWLLFLQPLFIGLLINLSQFKPTSAVAIFTFLAVTAVWLGLNNSARELVRERKRYVRERLLGVTPAGYLLSKVLLFGVIGLGQLALLVAMVRYGNFMLPDDSARDHLLEWPFWQIVFVNWIAYLSALLLGLTVSALSNSEETAIAWLPLIVLPELLLTAAATGLDQQSPETGHFRPLPLLARQVWRDSKEPGQARSRTQYALDGVSLFLYTRPAVSVLHSQGLSPADFRRWRPFDMIHALALLAGTAGLLAVVFRKKEKHWLENA